MVVFALTLSDLIERGGAYAGLAAFFGLAVMSILYFAQAREIRRLRDWAGRSPERAQELEERVVAQAEARREVKAQPIRRPGQPATVAAKAAAAASVAPPETPVVAPAEGETQVTAEGEAPAPEAEEGSATEHDIVKPSAGAPSEVGAGDEVVSEDETDAEAEEETTDDADPAVVPAGVAAREATTDAPTTVTPATPGTGSVLPPRATQGPSTSPPSPASPIRRPGQAASPLRSTAPATRRPVPPPRRPGPPPPLKRDEASPPGGRRTGIIAAGALAGVTLIVVGIIALVGGGDDSPTASTEDPVATAAATTEASTGGNGNGGNEEETPEPSGPARGDTTVAVLNGTAVSGLAGGLNTELVEAGYTEAQAPTNWVDQTRSASIVFYASSEYREQAIEIADQLEIADRQPIDDTALSLAPNANVVVLVGADQTP